MKQVLRFLAISGLAVAWFPTTSCTKATCSGYYNKMLSCVKNEKFKKRIAKRRKSSMARCEETLADKELGKWMKMSLACANKGSCEDFNQCRKEVRKARRAGRLPKSIAKAQERVEEKVKAGEFSKAVDRCRSDYDAWQGKESKNKKAQAAAKGYYDFCNKNIPEWLGKVRDAGGGYISMCSSLTSKYKSKRKRKRPPFHKRAGWDEATKNKILGLCEEVGFAKTMKRVKKSIAKRKTSFPYNCSVKRIKKHLEGASEAKKKMIEKLKDLCYKQVGLAILKTNMAKLKKKRRFRSCGFTNKRIAKGFKEFGIESPENKDTLAFFYKLCKIK